MQKKAPRSCNPKDLGPGKCKKHAKTMRANMQKHMQLALPKDSKQYTIHTQFILNSIFQYLHCFGLFSLCCLHLFFFPRFFCFCIFVAFSSSFYSVFWTFEDRRTSQKKANNARFQFVFHVCLHLFCTCISWLHFFCIFWSHLFCLHFFQVLAFLE